MIKKYSILSFGAGTQSTALALMCLRDEKYQLDAIIFADTGDEPRHTIHNAEIIRRLAEEKGVAFYWQKNEVYVKKGGKIQTSYEPRDGWILEKHDVRTSSLFEGPRWVSIPLYTGEGGALQRQCTGEFKIRRIKDAHLSFLEERGWVKRNSKGVRRVKPLVRVVSYIGFTYEEIERVKSYKRSSWNILSYPLIDARMTKADCIEYLKNQPENFSTLGSACKRCPYVASRWVKVLPEDEVAEIINYDRFIRSKEGRERFKALGYTQDMYLCRDLVPIENSTSQEVKECNELCTT